MTQRSISKSNPLSLAAAALITLWPSLAAAQNYTVRMKAADGTISTTYVSPTAVRNTSPELGQDIINRLDRGTIICLDHKNKMYREVTVDQPPRLGGRFVHAHAHLAECRHIIGRILLGLERMDNRKGTNQPHVRPARLQRIS